jgi:hypothetical protein
MKGLDPDLLENEIAQGFINWQQAYWRSLGPEEGEDEGHFQARRCCLAYTEGARKMQQLVQVAFLQAMAEVIDK